MQLIRTPKIHRHRYHLALKYDMRDLTHRLLCLFPELLRSPAGLLLGRFSLAVLDHVVEPLLVRVHLHVGLNLPRYSIHVNTNINININHPREQEMLKNLHTYFESCGYTWFDVRCLCFVLEWCLRKKNMNSQMLGIFRYEFRGTAPKTRRQRRRYQKTQRETRSRSRPHVVHLNMLHNERRGRANDNHFDENNTTTTTDAMDKIPPTYVGVNKLTCWRVMLSLCPPVVITSSKANTSSNAFACTFSSVRPPATSGTTANQISPPVER